MPVSTSARFVSTRGIEMRLSQLLPHASKLTTTYLNGHWRKHNKKQNLGTKNRVKQRYHWARPNVVFDNKQILHASLLQYTRFTQTLQVFCFLPIFRKFISHCSICELSLERLTDYCNLRQW